MPTPRSEPGPPRAPDALEALDVVIGLGSSLGDRTMLLRGAVRALADLALAEPRALSPLYETESVGAPGPPYLNAAMRLGWNGPPRALLMALLSIEARFGRLRRERFEPRTLDLDVLWIEGVALGDPDLVVPHPRLLERRFALGPLLDVAPEALHPSTGVRLSTWLPSLSSDGVRRATGDDWAGRFPARLQRGQNAG